MTQTTESILSLVNMTIACGNWQECVFFKYKIPTELRIQIWELYFSNEPRPPTARYRTPNLIKALRMKERPELYHEALQCFWAVTTFIYSSHSFRNFGVSGDRNQLASIQNLTCYFDPLSLTDVPGWYSTHVHVFGEGQRKVFRASGVRNLVLYINPRGDHEFDNIYSDIRDALK